MKLITSNEYVLTDSPRLDWLTLNSYRPTLMKTKNGQAEEVGKIIHLLSDNFKIKDKNGVIESECGSIYIGKSTTNLNIQFRGVFFSLYGELSWPYIKYIYKQLMKTNPQCQEWQMLRDGLEANWSITRMDVKRDIEIQWWELAPIGNNAYKQLYDKDAEYTFFKCDKKPYENKNNIDTGITYTLGKHWRLNIYNKTVENEIQKNLEKKNIYDRVIDGKNITRIELRINGTQSNSYVNWLIKNKPEISEEEISKEFLAKWMTSHQVKTPDDKIEPRWKDLFDGEGIRKKRNEYPRFEMKDSNHLITAERFLKAFAGKFVENGLNLEQAKEYLEVVFGQKQATYNEQVEKLEAGRVVAQSEDDER